MRSINVLLLVRVQMDCVQMDCHYPHFYGEENRDLEKWGTLLKIMELRPEIEHRNSDSRACGYKHRGSLEDRLVKNLPAVQETQVWSLVRKIPWRRKCNPLQYPCLENPRERGAWRAIVHGVARVGHDLATKPSHKLPSSSIV